MAPPRSPVVQLETLWERAAAPAFLVDADRRLILVNPAWEELTGHPAAQVAGLACLEHGPTRPGDLADLGGAFCPPPEAFAGRPAGATTLILRPDGERLLRRVEYFPLLDNRASLLAILGLVLDPQADSHAPDSPAHRLRVELLEAREQSHRRREGDATIGRGAAHRRLIDQVAAAAATSVPALILGEPGTGKRTVARAIHQQSTRREGPLLAYDCAAIPPEILDRGLFGPATDPAAAPRLAPAEGATIFLADVLDLPRDIQGRLVAALDGRVRLLAATSGDPDDARRSDRLRPDLYYAITTLVIRLAPLRERPDELPILAQHFLERANRRGGRQRPGFDPSALNILLGHDWPGNLAELARVVDAAHGRGEGASVAPEDLPAAIRGSLGSAYVPPPAPSTIGPLDESLAAFERQQIEHALRASGRRKSRAADLLAISRPRLYRRMKELGIPDEPGSG